MPIKTPKKYFDNDRRLVSPEPALPATAIKPISRRRKYAHDFSSGRQLKRIINAKGRAVWRRVPDRAIVFYGKQLSKRRVRIVSPTGKVSYSFRKQEE